MEDKKAAMDAEMVRYAMREGRSARYTVDLIDEFVVLEHLGETNSITNDAEKVVADLEARGLLAGGRRILYQDLPGRWDELRHGAGAVVGFVPMGKLPLKHALSVARGEAQVVDGFPKVAKALESCRTASELSRRAERERHAASERAARATLEFEAWRREHPLRAWLHRRAVVRNVRCGELGDRAATHVAEEAAARGLDAQRRKELREAEEWAARERASGLAAVIHLEAEQRRGRGEAPLANERPLERAAKNVLREGAGPQIGTGRSPGRPVTRGRGGRGWER